MFKLFFFQSVIICNGTDLVVHCGTFLNASTYVWCFSGLPTSLVRIPGWSTGPGKKSVSLTHTGPPASASTRWRRRTTHLDVRRSESTLPLYWPESIVMKENYKCEKNKALSKTVTKFKKKKKSADYSLQCDAFESKTSDWMRLYCKLG